MTGWFTEILFIVYSSLLISKLLYPVICIFGSLGYEEAHTHCLIFCLKDICLVSGRIHPGIYDLLGIYLTCRDILTVGEVRNGIPFLAVGTLVAELLLDLA